MYRYIIGQDHWECYHQVEVLHTIEYSQDEFLNICKQALSNLNREDRKVICNSHGDAGAKFIKDILINEFGFVPSQEITGHVHLLDLLGNYSGYRSCKDCLKSYELNGEVNCIYDDCPRKEFINDIE